MERKEQDKVMAFDMLFTTNHIQMLKVLMAYMEPHVQKSIALCIKLMELQYALSFFRMHPNASLNGLPREESFRPEKLLDEILPYCTPSEQENLSNLKNTMESFSNMQEMMQMVQSMKELFPEGESGQEGDMSNILSALGAMSGSDSDGFDLTQLMSLIQGLKE